MADRTLRLNDSGDDVREAQDLLNRAGAILDADGQFGEGTARALAEFRAMNGLPASLVVDADAWQRLRALPLPNPDIPTRAVAFIAREEVSSRAYYDKVCSVPSWPGGASGVTIGVGYDLGYQANFASDWGDRLPPSEIAALKPALGVKGDAAKALAEKLSGIHVPWAAAWSAFVGRTLPDHVGLTRSTFRSPAGRSLSPLCLGVLVSLVYNRGAGMEDSAGKDNRLEMRQIRDAVAKGDFGAVPAALRSMQRLWPAGNGLRDRREREASLFEAGLAGA